jgi:hypothetical protein
MDFSGYCLYGIWACAVIRSKLFLDRRWAIGSGLIGDFLVLHRFLTVVYLLGVCAGFAGVCVAGGVAARCFGRSGNFGMKPATYRDETFLLQVIFLLGACRGLRASTSSPARSFRVLPLQF